MLDNSLDITLGFAKTIYFGRTKKVYTSREVEMTLSTS